MSQKNSYYFSYLLKTLFANAFLIIFIFTNILNLLNQKLNKELLNFCYEISNIIIIKIISHIHSNVSNLDKYEFILNFIK